MKVADFFVWFGRNPAAAVQILKEEVRFAIRKPVTTSESIEERKHYLEEARRRYPGELPRLALGGSLLFSLLLILLFFSTYLILYMMHI